MQAQRQQQQRACPPIFQAMAPVQEPPAGCMERLASGPVQSRATDPDWVPSQLTRACSEGTDANQGRCKCGEAPRRFPGSSTYCPGDSVQRRLCLSCVLCHLLCCLDTWVEQY